MKNPTFADIAEYTHFSKTTISRYFNNPDSLTLENQAKIRDALIKLNYKENKVAKILANGKTEMIGFIIPNMQNPYYPAALQKLLMSYSEYGYKFLVFVSDDAEDTERKYLEELMSYKVEGLLILSHVLHSSELAELNIPIVSIEREDSCISSVNSDNYNGARMAVELLEKHQCDIYAYIYAPVLKRLPSPSGKRVNGFQDYCEEHQLPYRLYPHDETPDREAKAAILTDIFEQIEDTYPHKKKGLFFGNDLDAFLFTNIVLKKYKTFPSDYRIIGYDGIHLSQDTILPVSTVDQQIDRLVDEAMDLLMKQIEEQKKRRPKPLTPEHRIVTPVVIPRTSTELLPD